MNLLTPRLKLRQWEPCDFEPYAEICADKEVMQYLSGAPLSRLEAWRSMAFMMGHWQMRGYGHWAVEERSSGQFIGRLGFLYPEGWPGIEIGWTLSRNSWGMGYATEGASKALEYAQNELKVDEIISIIRKGNIASQKVALKLGGYYQKNAVLMGYNVDIYKVF